MPTLSSGMGCSQGPPGHGEVKFPLVPAPRPRVFLIKCRARGHASTSASGMGSDTGAGVPPSSARHSHRAVCTATAFPI